MYYNKYYPSNVSIPPIEGEYAYYSKNIQKFVSDLFYCVRPRWIAEIKNFPDRIFYIHFSSPFILEDSYNCVCIGKCNKVIEKLNLIELKKNIKLI
tara:strand:- start:1070 stop:1357 length:288 start_codon:yes stop_codon:yes gene_type:complete